MATTTTCPSSDELATGQVKTHVMRSRYYAVSVARLCELMRKAGFESKRAAEALLNATYCMSTIE